MESKERQIIALVDGAVCKKAYARKLYDEANDALALAQRLMEEIKESGRYDK